MTSRPQESSSLNRSSRLNRGNKNFSEKMKDLGISGKQFNNYDSKPRLKRKGDSINFNVANGGDWYGEEKVTIKERVHTKIIWRNLTYFISEFICIAVFAILYAVQAFSDHTTCSGESGKNMTDLAIAVLLTCFILHTVQFCNSAFFSPYFQINFLMTVHEFKVK